MSTAKSIRYLFLAAYVIISTFLILAAHLAGMTSAIGLWVGLVILAFVFSFNAILFERPLYHSDNRTLARSSVFGIISGFSSFWMSAIYVLGLICFAVFDLHAYFSSAGFIAWTSTYIALVFFTLVAAKLTSSVSSNQISPSLSNVTTALERLNSQLQNQDYADLRRINDYLKYRLNRSHDIDAHLLVELELAVDECLRTSSSGRESNHVEVGLKRIYDVLVSI
jgi:hypothetical protein